ncbi:hypothetical protein BC941DRAFT_470948 [Chlamydoabsidia padenii]|nr:hypothetical protein BC941DRAFT_470948 [Chlamydoabsidia padenii]
MLRLYSIMQLEHLWSKPSTTTSTKIQTTTGAATTFTPFPPFFGDDTMLDDDSILDVHPVAVETTEFQEPHQQGRKEEGLTTTKYIQQTKPYQQEPEHNHQSITSTSSSSTSLTISASDQVLSTSLKDLSTMPPILITHKEEHRYKEKSNLKAKHQPIHNIHFQQPPYDLLPPLTCDLTSITEENQDQVNDSSLISTSTGSSSFPITPTSTFSTPMPSTRGGHSRLHHHPLKDFKFSERRKNMTNKLKRAFSTNHHGKRNNNNRSAVPS